MSALILKKEKFLALPVWWEAGRNEVARAIFGADPVDAGEIYTLGQRRISRVPAIRLSPASAICLTKEDRKRYGLTLAWM